MTGGTLTLDAVGVGSNRFAAQSARRRDSFTDYCVVVCWPVSVALVCVVGTIWPLVVWTL
jgi:hypothetical protein